MAVTVVSARRFKNSGLTRAALRGGEFRGVTALGDLAAEMVTALRGPGLRLVYGYHADLDALGHEYGPGSLPWRMQLAAVDRLAASIAENLPSDAVLAVTGDHGMVTVDRRVDADTHPDLQRDVALLGGDPRSRLVYARRGAAADVLATWREVLGDAALVVSGEEAVAAGLVRPRVQARRRPDRRRGRGRPRRDGDRALGGGAGVVGAAGPARGAVGGGAVGPPPPRPHPLTPARVGTFIRERRSGASRDPRARVGRNP